MSIRQLIKSTNGGTLPPTGDLISAGSSYWAAIAASLTGEKLVAAAFGGNIAISGDFGKTWRERTEPGSRYWHAVASSADGSKLAAAALDGTIYTSADFGETWQFRITTGSAYGIASSADGSKLVTGGLGVNIRTSADFGETWQVIANSPTSCYHPSSSADGSKLVVGNHSSDGYLYTSSNSGASWVKRIASPGGIFTWTGTATSADGQKILAVSYSGDVFTSLNAGTTWNTSSAPAQPWRNATMSQDGTKMAICAQNGNICTSADSGNTWTTITAAGIRDWRGIAMSGDGSFGIAGAGGGYMYVFSI